MVGVSPALAADPDPREFTPPGYEFCGWQDFVNGGWAMEWSDDLRGAAVVAFADGMSCPSARRNIKLMRYSKDAAHRPLRGGYRCRRLASGYESSDVRCVKADGSRKFRFKSGS